MASISVSNDGPTYAMTTSMRKFAPNALRLLLAVIPAMAAFACTSPPEPEPTATPDIEATITAAVAAALPTSTPRLLQSQLPRVILPPRLPRSIGHRHRRAPTSTPSIIAPTPIPPTASPQPVSAGAIAPDYTSLTAGGKHTCQLQADASVLCWGADDADQSTSPAGEFVSVSAGGEHTRGIRTDNTAVCWGSNDSGQSGPPPEEFVALSAGRTHTCALQSDGTVTCWGSNEYGQTTPPTGRSSPSAREVNTPVACAPAACSNVRGTTTTVSPRRKATVSNPSAPATSILVASNETPP